MRRQGAPCEGVDEVGELGDGEGGHAVQVVPDAVADGLQAERIHGQRPHLLVIGWLLLRRRLQRRLRRRSGGGRHRCAVARHRSASGGAGRLLFR